jgi:hypothetical protein
VGSGVAVKPDGDSNRKRVVDEVKKFLAKKSLLKDPKTVKTYTERLGYFLDLCERSGIKHLDRLTHGDDLLPFVSFLRQRKTTRDTLFEPRYVYNIFQTCNTFLRANGKTIENSGGRDWRRTDAGGGDSDSRLPTCSLI